MYNTRNGDFMNLQIDYISDLHLDFYIKNSNDIEEFISKNIKPKVNGELLILAGDITANLNLLVNFLELLKVNYSKIIFCLGNHEYYNKIENVKNLIKLYNSGDIILLDRSSINKGLTNYKGFTIAGDTMWYKPNILDYLIQTDMFFVKSKINIYHKDSMNFYNKLNNVDIMVSHVPPIKNVNNTCYFNSVKDYKGRIWIYGHDHIPNEIVINKTLFLSNPWGYENKEFPVKSLTIKK